MRNDCDVSDPSHQLLRWRRAQRWVVYPYLPVLLALLVFGMPILGNMAYFFLLADLLSAGCRTGSEGLPVNCFVNGVDVGGLASGYGIGIFLLGIINPILAIDVVAIVLPKPLLALWSLAAGLIQGRLYWLRRCAARQKQRETTRSG